MPLLARPLLPGLLPLILLAGCGGAGETSNGAAAAAEANEAAPAVFQPLQSDQVKDAMHRALTTGETQRWEDGAYSGYAVPGPPGANGCRAIRYTVDQRRDVPFESITACEAN